MSMLHMINPLQHSCLPKTLDFFLFILLMNFQHCSFIWHRHPSSPDSDQPIQQSTSLTPSCSNQFIEPGSIVSVPITVYNQPSVTSCFLLSGPTLTKSISMYILQYRLATFYSSLCCANLLFFSLTL